MKITLATIKSFIKKNQAKPGETGPLYIKVKSRFDGMVDMVTETKEDFKKLQWMDDANRINKYNLGFQGIWLVGQSRDYFTPYEDEQLKGYEVYNCCGTFILAIKK